MAKTEMTKPIGLPASLGPASLGDIAAAAFARFERGAAPDEVVSELVLPVETVRISLGHLGSATRHRTAVGRGRAGASRSPALQPAVGQR
jgi:hypothetical protein